jgi:DnaK suppressor protein
MGAQKSRTSSVKKTAGKKTGKKKAEKKAAKKKPAPKKPAKAKAQKPAPKAKPAKKPAATAKAPAKAQKAAPKAKSAPPPRRSSRPPAPAEAVAGVVAPSPKPAAKPKAPKPPPKPLLPVEFVDEPEPAEDEPMPEPTVAYADGNGAMLTAHPFAQLTKVQLKKLHQKLLEERKRIVEGMGQRLSDAIMDIDPLADEIDIAQRHTEQASLMRFADKERKLLGEIDHALEKMEKTGEYGVCEGTEEPISFKRLEVRPWTRYSVAHKEQLERERKQHRR